jgi:hypothetical protein
MKKIFNSLFIAAAITGIFSVSSCTKTCDVGYEGDNCKTEVRTKYLGNFNGTEVCNQTNVTIAVNALTVSSDVVKVTFFNLYGAGYNTTGTVQSDGTITIATQAFGTGSISGSASIVSGKVKIEYVITAGGQSDNCTWTQS